MENRYNNSNDFERFVKQNADQYRMFPSEKVWKGIHNRLHTRRRWYGLGLAFLLISTGVVTWVMLVSPSKKQQTTSTTAANYFEKNAPSQNQVKQSPLIAVNKQPNQKPALGHTPFPTASYSNTAVQGNSFTPILSNEEQINNSLDETKQYVAATAINVPQPSVAAQKNLENNIKISQIAKSQNKQTAAIPESTTAAIEKATTITTNGAPFADKKDSNSLQQLTGSPQSEVNPLTIESVVNSYKRPSAKKKLTWMAYLTPTISYRALNENKAFINAARAVTNSGTPALLTYLPSDLESVVNHKPDIGFQLGFSAGYPLSKKIKLLSGFQFNINKYDIQAYNYSNEVATVALSTAAGRTNTVSTLTNYRIEGGYNRAKWLRNFYFTASIPVGFEVKLAENKKSYFGITATAQPTYILDNRSYLVSTDYKNYVEIPSLTRKWNLNTGFEVFAGIKAAGTEWRIGPQVRYQTLSSYKNKYPIEERLFDFGLKLGVVLK